MQIVILRFWRSLVGPADLHYLRGSFLLLPPLPDSLLDETTRFLDHGFCRGEIGFEICCSQYLRSKLSSLLLEIVPRVTEYILQKNTKPYLDNFFCELPV